MIDLNTLNAPQAEAVQTTEGPVLILAGAGSGKTRALTFRIAYLIEEGVNPWNILAITFTNKAAAEMRERVDRLVDFGAESIWVSTFHSMCARILRRHGSFLGYDQAFTIYDTDDQKTLIRQCIKKLDFDPKMYKERNVLAEISAAKNEMISPDDFAREASGDFRRMQLGEIYAEYESQCLKNNAMDFDDLLVKTVKLLQENREVREYYQERFRYILVDEYQDTNTVQFELVRLLAGKYKNLCVVGDDDQSIYKFRGANIYNILNFEKEYPGAKVIRLEQNYRSTQNILDAAYGVIHNNQGRKEKRLWTDQEGGAKVRYRAFDTAREEAEAILRDIEKAVEAGCERKECAILYRTNAQSRVLEEQCVARDMPYRLVGGVNFYQRMEIKDILAYLKTVENGSDDLAVQRIINVPKRGIGATSIGKLMTFAQVNEMSFYEACRHAPYIPGMGKAAAKVESFVAEIESFRKLAEEESLQELIEDILEKTGYQKELEEENTVESQTRLENIEEMISKAVDFEKDAEDTDTKPTLGDFLEQVSLVSDLDSVNADEDRIFLMTLHSAKGLEFERVYLSGMEDGLFPSYMSISSGDPEELEEERRLCYVGITRAKKELMLTSAKSRMVNGETRFNRPSRFIDEIPAEVMDGSRAKSPYEEWKSAHPEYAGAMKSGQGVYGSVGYYAAKASAAEGYTGASGGYGRSAGMGQGRSGARKGAGLSKSIDSANPGFGKSWDADDAKAVYSLKKTAAAAADGDLGYHTGDRVRHKKFGEGIVREIEEQTRDSLVTVDFDTAGTKKMYAGFAKLEKIEES